MLNKNITRLAAIGVAAVAIIGASAGMAMAATQSNGSEGPVYVYNPIDETLYAPGHVFAFSDEAVIGQSKTDAQAPFVCPVDSTYAQTFIAPIGRERSKADWVAYADQGTQKGQVEPTTTLDAQILGAQAQVKAQGGSYSVGLACLKDNKVNFASSGIWYYTVHVTAGTGAYTVDQPDEDAVVTPPVGEADVTLTANTVAAEDGTLSLVVPTGVSAVIGNPTLVNQLSTSTGTLGNFQVTDGRVVTHTGWTLTSTVADFTNGAVTIDRKQLGVSPKVVSTTASGVTAGAAQLAGSGVYPSEFASASNAAQVGTTVLDADLVFVAPADKPAGTYTSKLTLTLASK